MSTKSLKAQLAAAIAMVLVATIALGGSTFAWFAANNSVDAETLTVTAKSDAVFLEIAGSDAVNFNVEGEHASNPDGYGSIAKSTAAETKLFPCSHGTAALTANTVGAFDAAGDTWFYSYSKDRTDAGKVGSAKNIGEKYKLTNADTATDYFATVSYKVRLHDENAEAGKLYVKSLTLPEDTGVRAIVKVGNNFEEFTADVSERLAPTSTEVGTKAPALADTVTHTDTTVTVYLYFDGEDENVTTANLDAAGLTGKVSLTLACEPNVAA